MIVVAMKYCSAPSLTLPRKQGREYIENISVVPSPVYGGGLGRGHVLVLLQEERCPSLAPYVHGGGSREFVPTPWKSQYLSGGTSLKIRTTTHELNNADL